MNSNKQKLFINKINNIQINPFNFEGNEYHKKIQSKIIKNIDLGTKSLLSSSKKNMSNCDIKHLQINIIENEIIINNTHLKKNGNNDIRLTQNLNHNSSIKINSDNKKINKGKNNKLSKTHIKNACYYIRLVTGIYHFPVFHQVIIIVSVSAGIKQGRTDTLPARYVLPPPHKKTPAFRGFSED